MGGPSIAIGAWAFSFGPFAGHPWPDGTLHDGETSTHVPFGRGRIDFKAVLSAIKPVVTRLKWWCADFCFCAETELVAREGVPFLRNLREGIL